MIMPIPITTRQIRTARICHGFLRTLPGAIPLIRTYLLNTPWVMTSKPKRSINQRHRSRSVQLGQMNRDGGVIAVDNNV